MFSKIRYITGDATEPVGDGHKIICHVVNDVGKWGKGFVLALSDRWPNVRDDYLKWYNDRDKPMSQPFWGGTVRLVNVSGDSDSSIYVAHMLAQTGIRDWQKPDETLLQYNYLAQCLGTVAEYAASIGASIHMPKIGSGLAGGDWNRIEGIITEEIVSKYGLSPYVYTLE